MSRFTSGMEAPAPRAIRSFRESFSCTSQSSSVSVMLSMMTIKRLILFTPSFSAPAGIKLDIPGIICIS
eukprot:Skav209781  [mRNA]  locus=scaffold9:589406:590690:+ [translate_table: standard]